MNTLHPLFQRSVLMSLALFVTASAIAQPAVAPANERSLNPAAGSHDTVAVVAVQSYDGMLADINFLGGLAGRPEVGQMLEGFLALFTQGKGLVGLDKTKPWGVMLQTDGVEFMPVGCLPVNNVRELVSLLAAFQVEVEDLGDGILELQPPEKPSMYIKSAGGWAFVASDIVHLDTLPAQPEQQLAALLTEYDVAARVAVQKIPAEYRQLAVEQLRSGLEEGLERAEDEDDETYEMRRRWAESQMENVVRMIEEIDDVTVGWSVDAADARTFIDLTYMVIPGSRLDKVLASAAANSHTNYPGFYQPDAAICVTVASHTDPALIQDDLEQMRAMMKAVKQQIAKEIDDEDDDLPADPAARETIKQAAYDLIDAFMATAETGHVEGGAVVNMYPESLTIVAGGQVHDTSKIESALKKLESVAQREPDFPGVTWNADQHAGVAFHTIAAPVEEDDSDGRQLFGDTVDISVGIGEQSVFVGVGRENLAALKGVIDASANNPGKDVPLAEFLIALGPIMETAAALEDDEQEKMITQMIADMLRTEAQGRDHIRIVGQPIEHGLRYRIEAEEGVLRAIGKAADAAQQAAAAEGF